MNTDRKDRLRELQSQLNNVVIYDNLHSAEILELSTKLDELIVDYYLLPKEKKEETNIPEFEVCRL